MAPIFYHVGHNYIHTWHVLAIRRMRRNTCLREWIEESQRIGFYWSIDTRYSKTSSSHGMISPMSWSKPNSSSAWCKRLWNSGLLRYEIGIMYRLLFSPTYTAKCPFGTSKGSPSSLSKLCFLPILVHLFIICLSTTAFCDILLDFVMTILVERIFEEIIRRICRRNIYDYTFCVALFWENGVWWEEVRARVQIYSVWMLEVGPQH